MKELIERLKAPTPKFFKRLIKLGLSVGAVGGAILLAPTTLAAAGITGIVLPAMLVKTAEGMAIAGAVASAVAKLTKDDKVIKEK